MALFSLPPNSPIREALPEKVSTGLARMSFEYQARCNDLWEMYSKMLISDDGNLRTVATQGFNLLTARCRGYGAELAKLMELSKFPQAELETIAASLKG